MNIGRYIPDHAITTVPVLAALVAVHYFLLRDGPLENDIEVTQAPAYYEHWQNTGDISDLDIDAGLERLEIDDAARDRLIRELLQQGDYRHARTQLLLVAAAAVRQDDQQRLGDTMLLLGEVAIHQQELAAAEIYLQEALFLTMQQDNLMGTARGYQLLGHLNIRARELARQAANTYDNLWQARNAMSRGLYNGVEDNLRSVIRENLEIRRYGAAADAWEAMASLYDRLHDNYQSQKARLEAARLFASTGQMTQVKRLIDGLDRSMLSDSDMSDIQREIDAEFEAHQKDFIKSSQARDYQMLYHHYRRLGQKDRAWEFRIKASQTQASTSDRALFQRQSDIVAVLYSSNFAMERARTYLDKAGAIFDQNGGFEQLEQNRNLKTKIW